MSERPRKPLSRKSIAGQTLFVIALLLITRFFWMRDQPERLSNLPTSISRIVGNSIYTLTGAYSFVPAIRHPGEAFKPSILAQSILAPGTRTIVQEDPRFQFYHFDTGVPFNVTRGKIYYAIEPLSPNGGATSPKFFSSSQVIGEFAAGGSTAVPGQQNLGDFRIQPIRPSNPGVSGRKPALPFPIHEVRFRQIAAQGGSPQDILTLRSGSFCLIEGYVFWVRPSSEDTTRQISRPGTTWREETAQSELMLTSLMDGKTRCIRAGIPRDTRLMAGNSGVAWQEPAPFPEPPRLFYARFSDGSVHSLGTVGENKTYLASLMEFGNRLYWKANIVPLPSAQNKPFHAVLMRCNLDGTDTHQVCEEVDKHLIEDLSLHSYQGDLYAYLVEKPTVTEDPSRRKHYLCRLHPDRSDPLEILRKLPGGNATKFTSNPQFDGGYLYFVLTEQKRTLWASLTNDDVGAESANTLCRFPLAH